MAGSYPFLSFSSECHPHPQDSSYHPSGIRPPSIFYLRTLWVSLKSLSPNCNYIFACILVTICLYDPWGWNQAQCLGPQGLATQAPLIGCRGLSASCSQLQTSALSPAGQPLITLTGPPQRTAPGNPVSFNCTAGPFSSTDFNVTWMKDGDERPASAQGLVTDNKGNYSVTSKVWVTLVQQDVSSEITCEVTHRDLAEPLRKTMNLSQVLRGEWAVGWCWLLKLPPPPSPMALMGK